MSTVIAITPQRLLECVDEARPCMNPQSVLWPLYDDPCPVVSITSQKRRRPRDWDRPIIILNQ